MKKFYLFIGFGISFAAIQVLTGCKKSNRSSVGGGQISASVGSQAWIGDDSRTNTSIESSLSGVKVFTMVGYQQKNGDSTQLALSFDLPFVLNKSFGSDTLVIALNYYDSHAAVQYWGGVSGGSVQVTVTDFDSVHQTIAGVFSGLLVNAAINPTDSLVVSNGSFNGSYVTQ